MKRVLGRYRTMVDVNASGEMITSKRVLDALAIEKQLLLKFTVVPLLPDDLDGRTEFRVLNAKEVQDAVDIIQTSD